MPFLPIDDAELFYATAGAGKPAIVLVHGGMCDHRDWEHQIDALAADRTVVAVDLRAHGRSTGDPADCDVGRWADDLNTLVDTLAFAPAVLVGHSLASRIVAEAAWRRPDNAAALLLLDGSRSYGGHAAREPSTPATAPPVASLEELLTVTIGPHADAATRERVLEEMLSASRELMAAAVGALREWDLGRADIVFPALRREMPVLAVQSTYHDQFTLRRSLHGPDDTTPYLDFLRQAMPQLETAILPSTGHFSMLERSGEVTALIRDFSARALGE